MLTLRLYPLLLMMAALLSCAGTPTANNTTSNNAAPASRLIDKPALSPSQQRHWHAVRVRMPRDLKGQPVWAMDLLLAHRIFAPLLATYQQQIPLWRFHRRAGRDTTGHQFSWIFYADDQTAQVVFQLIKNEPMIRQAEERIQTVITQPRAYPTAQHITATSDERWAKPMQQAWPYYMTGVSQMWLTIIDQIQPQPASAESASFDQLLTQYQDTNRAINELWRDQGQHALLHHLSAAFGYQPLFFGNLIQF